MPTGSESNRWRSGDAVTLLRPDLSGHSGLVSEVLPDGRVIVEATVFGRATMFELDPGDLSPSN